MAEAAMEAATRIMAKKENFILDEVGESSKVNRVRRNSKLVSSFGWL